MNKINQLKDLRTKEKENNEDSSDNEKERGNEDPDEMENDIIDHEHEHEHEDQVNVVRNSAEVIAPSLANRAVVIKKSIAEDEKSHQLKDSKVNIPKKPNTNNRIEIDAKNEEDKKKIFMTEHYMKFDNKDLFTFHDLIVPGGKNAKLCLVNEPFNRNLRVTEIADHFSFHEPTPVIVLIGANTKRKGKLFAGLSRAAFNTRAVIIDSGLQSGVEKFCIRKNINLIGIAPESMIEYPKPNPEPFSNTMITSGHSHFILLGKDDKTLKWGDEAKFKINFAERLSAGRKGFAYKSKVCGVILGNIPSCEDEIISFIERKWPLIIIEDSDLSQMIKSVKNGEEPEEKIDEILWKKAVTIGSYSKLIEIEDDSENLASAVHICLTITF